MKKVLSLVLVLCMILSSAIAVFAEDDLTAAAPNYVSGPTGSEYGVTNILVVDNCEDDNTSFLGGSQETTIVSRGIGSRKYAYAAGEYALGTIMFRMVLETPVDASSFDRFAFDFYISDASAIANTEFCLELTSSGTCDEQEQQQILKLGRLTADKELVNGWNTLYVTVNHDSDCDFSRFNYLRLFNNGAASASSDFVICFDNVRFETYVEGGPLSDAGVETHQFTVFAEDEKAYLVRSDAGDNGTQRFSDAQKETVYKFTVTNRYSATKVTFGAQLGAQLLLQVSQDDKTWTDVYVYEYDESGEPSQGLRTSYYEYDLTSFVDLKNCADIYIRIADAYPDNGWGGSIFKSEPAALTVDYTPLTDDELNAFEVAGDENSVSLYGFNKVFGSFELDKENRTAGSASCSLYVGKGSVNDVKFATPVNGTGMDTLTFDLYISDLALFDAKFGNDALELTSSGKCDNSEIAWKLAEIKSNNLGGELVAGWNHIILPLSTAKATDGSTGAFDISAINYMRFFMVNGEEDYNITIKFDNMRLDNSGIARAAEQLAKDTAVAEQVIKLIDAIGDVTLKSDNAITKAENAYKKLTSAQKALVTNKDALTDARAKYAELVKAEEEKNNQSGEQTGGDENQKPEDETKEPENPEEPGDSDDNKSESSNNTVVTIIVIVAVVVIAAAVCVYFLVIKKKK